jgi:hypothetical protein
MNKPKLNNEYYLIEGEKRNNSGDVLQGLVAKQFLSIDSKCIDREKIKSGNYADGIVISNGWFQHNIEEFPVKENQYPIYISVHIAKSELLQKESTREHLKKYAPIGCRDKKTMQLLSFWGIPSYFSSCLTITSNKLIKGSIIKSNEILLIDNIDHPIPINTIYKIEELFGKQLIRINHNPKSKETNFEEYIESESENVIQFLQKYQNSDYIVTSKLHAALPCLALKKKVLFIHPNPSDKRLSTLNEYIQIYSYNEVNLWKKIPEFNFKNEKFEKHQIKIEKIITQSILRRINILQKSNDPELILINIKSIIISFIFNNIRIILTKTKMCPLKFKQIFQSKNE